MRLPLQLALILSLCFLGEFARAFLKIPVPGSILGMIFLFILLCLKWVKVEQIETSSRFFLKYLPFFFIPAGVGVLGIYDSLKGQILILVSLCVLITIVCTAFTGITVEILDKITGEGDSPIFKKTFKKTKLFLKKKRREKLKKKARDE